MKRPKELVVAALRSGKYKQRKGSMHNKAGDFCVWGVICDTYRMATRKGKWSKRGDMDGDLLFVLGREVSSAISPPEAVRTWFGEDCIQVNGKSGYLMGHNDTGATFEEIATGIEKEDNNATT